MTLEQLCLLSTVAEEEKSAEAVCWPTAAAEEPAVRPAEAQSLVESLAMTEKVLHIAVLPQRSECCT